MGRSRSASSLSDSDAARPGIGGARWRPRGRQGTGGDGWWARKSSTDLTGNDRKTFSLHHQGCPSRVAAFSQSGPHTARRMAARHRQTAIDDRASMCPSWLLTARRFKGGKGGSGQGAKMARLDASLWKSGSQALRFSFPCSAPSVPPQNKETRRQGHNDIKQSVARTS